MNINRSSVLSILFALWSCLAAQGQTRNRAYEQYIDKYKDIAIDEMERHHIPASITLAQGLLESGAGQRELLNFMYVLVDKGRFYGLHKMIKFYYDLDDEARGEGYGIVYSVCPLDEKQIGRFEDEVSKLFRKKIHLNNKIEKKLIGGVRLLVEGKILDASMAGRLDQIAEKIGVFG